MGTTGTFQSPLVFLRGIVHTGAASSQALNGRIRCIQQLSLLHSFKGSFVGPGWAWCLGTPSRAGRQRTARVVVMAGLVGVGGGGSAQS